MRVMGTRLGGGSARARERARVSFFIVVMFFAVFGLIVLTELLLVEPRETRTPSSGSQVGGDYEQFQGEDYLGVRLGVVRVVGGNAESKGRAPVPPVLEERLPPPPSNTTPPDAQWQPVGGTRYKFLVYSAFYEHRGGRSVRLIGATKTRGAERVWCRLWFNGNRSATVLAKVKMIRENWNLKYSACFIVCPLKRNQTCPESVSIAARPRAPLTNFLKVLGPRGDIMPPPPDSLAVCIKPLHFYYNRPLQLLEFIELNMLLGATHFMMYNHTVGKQAACILNHYQKQGVLSLFPWQLNMHSQKEIRTEGLFAALNDCLYRTMYHFTYAALIDLDEFIIPHKTDTLPSLLESLSERYDSKAAGAFSFQNAFFYLQWPDERPKQEDSRLVGALITQRKTRRRQKLHPHKQRSKYICRPERVFEAGNHFVWEFVTGSGALSIPPDQAILHHYRVCEFGGDDCIKTPSYVDKTALKYKTDLVERVQKKYDILRMSCSLPDLPPLPASVMRLAPVPHPLSPPV